MKIREQLRPYVMTLYQAAASNGTPIMRPLFFDFWEDPAAQGVDDELMFGPDYLVAPQLLENATSRPVYLPPLEDGYVWQNYFTLVETNTSHGGVNITEETPLATFPLYYKLKKARYPPPPKMPKCDNSCSLTPHSDTADGSAREIAHSNCTSFDSCCALCQSNPRCGAFVWGAFHQNKPASTVNPNTCFQLSPVASLKPNPGRSFGCVRTK